MDVGWNPYYPALLLHLWLLGYSLSDGNHRVGLPSGSVVENLSEMQQMQVRSLGGEDPLEEEMATHFNILAWKIPWTEELSGLHGVAKRVRPD